MNANATDLPEPSAKKTKETDTDSETTFSQEFESLVMQVRWHLGGFDWLQDFKALSGVGAFNGARAVQILYRGITTFLTTETFRSQPERERSWLQTAHDIIYDRLVQPLPEANSKAVLKDLVRALALKYDSIFPLEVQLQMLIIEYQAVCHTPEVAVKRRQVMSLLRIVQPSISDGDGMDCFNLMTGIHLLCKTHSEFYSCCKNNFIENGKWNWTGMVDCYNLLKLEQDHSKQQQITLPSQQQPTHDIQLQLHGKSQSPGVNEQQRDQKPNPNPQQDKPAPSKKTAKPDKKAKFAGIPYDNIALFEQYASNFMCLRNFEAKTRWCIVCASDTHYSSKCRFYPPQLSKKKGLITWLLKTHRVTDHPSETVGRRPSDPARARRPSVQRRDRHIDEEAELPERRVYDVDEHGYPMDGDCDQYERKAR